MGAGIERFVGHMPPQQTTEALSSCFAIRCCMKKSVCLLFFVLFFSTLGAQQQREWLPHGSVFPSLQLDYREPQVAGSLYALHSDKKWQDRMFANFSVGFSRNIIRWTKDSRQRELGFELFVMTQFLFENPLGRFQVNLFSNEFKVGVHYQWQNNEKWRYRLRLYHISDHLGDDFIYRFLVNDYVDNLRIYEVIDLSVVRLTTHWKLYASAGVIPHSAYERLPLLGEIGFEWKRPINGHDWLQWFVGGHSHFEQETGFYPGTRLAFGIILGKTQQAPFTIMLDAYQGFLPFSLYDKVKVGWLGGSICFQPFRGR